MGRENGPLSVLSGTSPQETDYLSCYNHTSQYSIVSYIYHLKLLPLHLRMTSVGLLLTGSEETKILGVVSIAILPSCQYM